MKTMHFATAALLISSGIAYAASPMSHWGQPTDPVVKHITEIETLWSDTNCGPAQAKLGAAIATDFQGTSSRGGVRYDHSSALAPGSGRNCHLQQIKVHFFGDSLAVVYGNEGYMSNKNDGSVREICLAWTDTWLKRNGEWKIIAAQDNDVRCK